MVVGGNPQRYQSSTAAWQLYEVTGLGQGQTAQISQGPRPAGGLQQHRPDLHLGQPDHLLPRTARATARAHLYPQRDEYESANVESGLWKLNPVAQTYRILEHAPSGATYPAWIPRAA